MTAVTRAVGAVLILVGLAAWWVAGGPGTSWTALLPAVLGLLMLALGLLAGRQALHRHMIHAALVLALLGALGTAPRAADLLTGSPERPTAAWASLITGLVCLVYLALGVRSFVAARRAGDAGDV